MAALPGATKLGKRNFYLEKSTKTESCPRKSVLPSASFKDTTAGHRGLHVMPAFGKLRQEDCHKSYATMGSTVGSGSIHDTE